MVFLGQILVFSITGCPFCARAKKQLNDLGVPFVDVNLEKHPERRYEMQEKTGRRTVPQIFFNSKHVGGYDDLKKMASVLKPQNHERCDKIRRVSGQMPLNVLFCHDFCRYCKTRQLAGKKRCSKPSFSLSKLFITPNMR